MGLPIAITGVVNMLIPPALQATAHLHASGSMQNRHAVF